MILTNNKIAKWYDINERDLPWRHTRDAYKIWLSEIILQQTRVVQGIDYYRRFAERYPTVAALAEATEDEILKLWQGLGYYSRARHLHAAARQVMQEYNGIFPTRSADLIKLEGIGPYTAAAIASFSTDEHVAVVDGNVYRVLSRLYDDPTPIDTPAGARQFALLAKEMLPDTGAGRHNQAMMELGALCCTPTSPHCDSCPIADNCLALANGTIALRPVKQGRVKVRQRFLSYYIFIYEKTLWVRQRGAHDIWQGLWEFHLVESNAPTDHKPDPALIPEGAVVTTLACGRRHQLTHQLLTADFHAVVLKKPLDNPTGLRQVTWEEWQTLAVAKLISDANRLLSESHLFD